MSSGKSPEALAREFANTHNVTHFVGDLAETFARVAAEARREALEEACKAQCPNCARGEEPRSIPGYVYHPIPGTGGGGWPQASESCMAARILTLKEGRRQGGPGVIDMEKL